MLSAEDLKLIGGSDAGVLVGMDKYRQPIDIFSRIVNGTETTQTKPMRRGILLEPVIRELFRDETQLELRGPRSLRSPRHAFARASLDDVAVRDGEEIVVEYKSANVRMLHEWGEPGTDEVPRQYLCQVQWYMAMSGMHSADLAALIGGDDLRIYEIDEDKELQEMLFDAAAKFWTDHVLTGIPPAPDASEGYARFLKARFPKETLPMIRADDVACEWARKLRDAEEALEMAEQAKEEARQALIATIGPASGLEGPDFRISYKQSKGRASTDWAAVCQESKVPQTLIDRHTKRSPYRVFKPTWSKE